MCTSRHRSGGWNKSTKQGSNCTNNATAKKAGSGQQSSKAEEQDSGLEEAMDCSRSRRLICRAHRQRSRIQAAGYRGRRGLETDLKQEPRSNDKDHGRGAYIVPSWGHFPRAGWLVMADQVS